MGRDYVPFALKDGVTEAELQPWVMQQATTFQSMPHYWAYDEREWERSPEIDEMLVSLHLDACLAASEEISKRVDKTQESYRINAVTANQSFPISVRIGSMTTILPSLLPEFVDNWIKCAEVAKYGPWRGKTERWMGQIEWSEKFIVWAKDKRDKGQGLYLCW